MNQANHFTHGMRVANFSNIDLPVENLLEFDSGDTVSAVKKIRRHADLPYVFVVAKEHAQQARDVLTALQAIRSPCTPYALFTLAGAASEIDSSGLEIVPVDVGDGTAIGNIIDKYADATLCFDDNKLREGSTGSPPVTVDVVIVGGGITGLYAANRLMQQGISFCLVEKQDQLGGIWSMYANTTSRVNSSECAYRLINHDGRSNRDHSATREILEDLARLAGQVSDHVFLNTEVKRIEKQENGYRIDYVRNGSVSTVTGKGVILAINDRVGSPRKAEWDNQAAFKGEIVDGISDKATGVDWRGKKVVIVGMGAFAIENARTALEGGASHVSVVCRRHGTICPKIIDYLNFATPYDEAFKHDKKSNFRNMMYWKKMYDLSGATQPECWMGKVKHEGHTISVSDIWFVGHYLNKIQTVTGSVTGLSKNGVMVNGDQRIDAEIVVNCIGFERNASLAKALSGYGETTNVNYLDKDFMYLADAYIDDDAFNSFFGSSVLEMVKFYIEVYIHYFDNPLYNDMIRTEGITRLSIEDRRWSHYISGASQLIQHHPELHAIAKKQVDQRTENFLEKHDLNTYIEENKREWIDMHSMLAGKAVNEADCMPYVFDKLLPK